MLEIRLDSLRYPGQPRKLLSGTHIQLEKGELLFLRGPNGSGKTSLLNVVSGVIPQRIWADITGSIMLNGKDLADVPLNERHRLLAYQISDPDNQIFFPRLTKELAFALENMGLPAEEMRLRIENAARAFGLEAWLQREPHTLSLGEKKLLVLAVCAAQMTPLVLLDEPSAALSESGKERLRAWLTGYLAGGGMAIVAEHDPYLQSLATHTMELSL